MSVDLAPRKDVVLAIVLVHGAYVLQHRDNKPNIASPGLWSLFGGSPEHGESTVQSIRREIREELGLDIEVWRELWRVRHYSVFAQQVVRCIVFAADVTTGWYQHVLSEGQATGVFPVNALPQDMAPLARALVERYETTLKQTRL
jgi:8-oxo-dGTP pyrophosphatase MutT (NUDIX family)